MKKIIRKWYEILEFPFEFNDEFEKIIAENQVPEITADEYNSENYNAKENLLLFLYFCEELHNKYINLNIPNEIFVDTISDIVIWTKTHKKLNGELGISEVEWFKNHFSMRLFKLGRLQFCMGNTHTEIFEYPKGTPIIEVHIPATGAMKPELCKDSFEMAKNFFATYFPDYNYKAFTCYSWLLDKTLELFLDSNSNILAFQKMFDIQMETEPRFDALKFIFSWDIKKEELCNYPATNNFTKKLKQYVLDGGNLFLPYGVLKDSNL